MTSFKTPTGAISYRFEVDVSRDDCPQAFRQRPWTPEEVDALVAAVAGKVREQLADAVAGDKRLIARIEREDVS